MGFAITSSVFGGVTIICYSISIAIYHHDAYYDSYSWRSENFYHSEMAITAIILILGITEFFIGIWAAVLCCYISSCNCCPTQGSQVLRRLERVFRCCSVRETIKDYRKKDI